MRDLAHALADKELEDIEKRIEEIYRRANSEVEKKTAHYFKRFEAMDKQKRALVEAGEMTEEAYKKWKQGKIMTGKHWETLKKQTAESMHKANVIAADYANGRLPEVYAENYNQIAAGINKQIREVNFELVNQQTVRNLATQDNTLLPYKTVNGVKDVRWNTQKVNSEILQGILQGDSVADLSKRLRKVTEMNRASSVRNARTAVTSAENKGRIDMLHDAEDAGVRTKKVWLSVHDKRTRDAHLALSGVEADPDEPFEVFGMKIMYPGDPEAEPEMVYNCRCTMTYKVIGFWNQRDGQEDVETDEDDVHTFTPAKTKDEAEEYISQYVDSSLFGATGVDYTGIDLDTANEVNRVISNLQETYDVGKFGGIIAPAGNTREGKLIKGATAAYSPVRQSYYLNRTSFKSIATLEKNLAADRKAITDILEHPEKYDLTKASKRMITLIENSKVSGRATIPLNIEQVLQHEFGHSLEKKVVKHELWEKALNNMGKYAPKLSGYACQDKSEYIAESFCSYSQGEGKVDPVLAKIFKSFRR